MADCLVIIDMQMGFLNLDEDHMVDRVIQLMKEHTFDHVVATKFIGKKDSMFVRSLGWYGMQNRAEQQLVPKLCKHCERVFRKTGYTCFTDEFKKYLKEKNIRKLYFVGMDTDACVLKSVLDCFEAGIDYEVLVNYCSSSGGITMHNAGIDIMRRQVGEKYMNVDW